MKPVLYFAFVTLLLTSCLGKEIKSSPDEKTIEFPQLIQEKLGDFPLIALPYQIDSTFFDKDSNATYDNGNLSIEMVKLLASPLASDDASNRERYYLNDFYQIAEAKANGKYHELKKDLDIGMTENAQCKSIGRLEFGDSMSIVIWEIEYKSFDACPFFTGHHVLGSLIKDGKVISCMQLASHESSADAPMSIEMFQLTSIASNGVITVKTHSCTNEELMVVEKAQTFFKYKISGKGYSLLK